jgi:hypothetical protein
MAAIERMWRCQRLEGCNLDFRETPADLPLRLSQFVGRPNEPREPACVGSLLLSGVYRLSAEKVYEGAELRRRVVAAR